MNNAAKQTDERKRKRLCSSGLLAYLTLVASIPYLYFDILLLLQKNTGVDVKRVPLSFVETEAVAFLVRESS